MGLGTTYCGRMGQAEPAAKWHTEWWEEEVGDFGRGEAGLALDNWRGGRFVEGASDPMGRRPGVGLT